MTIQNTIPSYLYVQYADDDNLQSFVQAYNQITQQYVNTFNALNLPIYTLLSGELLDWVGQNLYGIARPSLPIGIGHNYGPFNTWALNTLPLNKRKYVAPSGYAPVNDDVYKRVITWNFYKGDGKVFTIRWLKRRLQRFLLGVNGTAPLINQTYDISVTLSATNQVNIRFITGNRTVTGGALFDKFLLNQRAFNSILSRYTPAPQNPMAPTLAAAINAGILELPFQYTYVVTLS